MQITLHLHGISLFEIAVWCRETGIPLVVLKRGMLRHPDGRQQNRYYSTATMIRKSMVARRLIRTAHLCALLRGDDYMLFVMRFGPTLATRGWDQRAL